MALKHEYLSFENGLVAQREVNSHLVAVEVGVERSTSQGVKLDCFTLNELGLEGLNTQTVKRRSTVEEHGVALHHVFKDVPDNGFATVYNLFGTLNRLNNAALDEFTDDKRFVKFGSHEFG